MEIEPQTVVSSVAAIIAAGAALIAWRSSTHAKRNADKALGDIEPFVEVFQTEKSLYNSETPCISVLMTNLNRRAMLLHKLELETNTEFIAYRTQGDDIELAFAGIIDVMVDDEAGYSADTHYLYEPPLRLPGHPSLAGDPPQYEFQYHVLERNGKQMEWQTTVGVNVKFTLDGQTEPTELRLELEVHRNGVEEWRSRFRSIPTKPTAS